MVKAISEVEGVLSQTTPEADTSSINQDSLHLIVPYWKLLEQAPVRWTKTLVMVAIKVVCVWADIKIFQPVAVTLYDRTIYREF
ncbi:hypothetical protein QUA70_09505 [Microcoleus sp. LAD1_D5]|uniref:hypothetical protein n=1 Tax=unclassified Microcoleus TaxID=2642155 RepID=UPI002FCE6BF6